jgi:bifunctional aspartokinase / homoserine dehydrogenase 1
MRTLTMKFGGASVGSTTALTQVLSIVLQEHERWDNLLLVVSALDGVTDSLIEAALHAQLSNRRGYRRIVTTLRTRHLSLVETLPLGVTERNALQADIDRLLFDMLDTCESLAEPATDHHPSTATMDKIIGVGERLSARIVAALLRQNNLRGVAIDATDLIVTDNVFGNATPILELTRQKIEQILLPMLSRNIIPVVTGFIGATRDGQPTTLGRGGSDYTGSILAVCAGANEVWMYTDVDGMMSADPQEVPNARTIPSLSYDEVAELAYFGARILHARMIGLLRENHIPLWIKNVFRPREAGTLITDMNPNTPRALKAVTSIQGLGLTAPYSGPLTEIADMIDKAMFTTTGSHGEVMISSQSSEDSFVCMVIPTTAGPEAIRSTQAALEKLLAASPTTSNWQVDLVSVVTVIGAHLDELPRALGSIFNALGNAHVLGLAQGPSHCNLSIILEPENADVVLEQIHSIILSS